MQSREYCKCGGDPYQIRMYIRQGGDIDFDEDIADEDELTSDGRLSEEGGFDFCGMGDDIKDEPSCHDDDIPAYDGDGEPGWYKPVKGKQNKGRNKEKFIRQGVKEVSQGGLLAFQAGNKPVKGVGERSDDKEVQCIIISAVNYRRHEQGNEYDPHHGEGVRYVQNTHKISSSPSAL